MNRTISSVLVGMVLWLVPQYGHALSFTVGSATVNAGNTFTITLNVAGAVNLTSWQFDLRYNSSILKANSVAEGPFLSSAGTTLFTPGVLDNTTGLISLTSASFVDIIAPSGNGVLATIQFTALAPGLSALTASNVFLNFLDSGFGLGNGSVCVRGGTQCTGTGGGGAVPEAGSLLFLTIAGSLLWGVRQWSRRGTQVNA